MQVAPVIETRGQSSYSSFGLPWWQVAVLLLLLGWLYGSILVRLAAQWTTDPNFSHGIAVPAFAAFILWKSRNRLRGLQASPSWGGFPLIVCALLMLVLGVFGAELFFSRISLLVLLAGLIIFFGGWTVLRAVAFPLAFLVLMIPLPTLLLQKVTFPLQVFTSKVAAWQLYLLAVPVLREGNVIVLASKRLEVAQACSGIRSLLTMVTLSIIYGYLMESRVWVRVLLAISAIPIAVVANSFRIVGTGLLVQYWDPEKAEGFFHLFEGWLIFVAALFMFFGLHQLIERLSASAPGRESA